MNGAHAAIPHPFRQADATLAKAAFRSAARSLSRGTQGRKEVTQVMIVAKGKGRDRACNPSRNMVCETVARNDYVYIPCVFSASAPMVMPG